MVRPQLTTDPVRARFDDFELDEVNASLLRRGKPVALALPPINYGTHPYHHVGMPGTVIMPQGIRMLISILVTFLVVILILYLINLLPLDGRAKQIARVVVIVLGVISLLKFIAVF